MQGHEPVELNDRGRAQINATARALAGLRPTHIISSPILRAVQSAELLCDELQTPRDTILLHPGLAEFHMGTWVGRTFMELWQDGTIQSYWDDPTHTHFPEGESMAAIQARAADALNALVASSGGGTLVLVTHGGIVRLLLLCALGLPRSHYHRLCASNASVSRIELVNGLPPKVHVMNATPALAVREGRLVS